MFLLYIQSGFTICMPVLQRVEANFLPFLPKSLFRLDQNTFHQRGRSIEIAWK